MLKANRHAEALSELSEVEVFFIIINRIWRLNCMVRIVQSWRKHTKS